MCSGIASSPAHLHLLQVSYINKCTSCLKKEYVFCLKTVVLSISRFTFFGIIYQFLKDPGFELLGNNVEGLRNTYSSSCYLLQIAVEFYHSSMCKHFYAFFLIIILHIFNIETETYEGNKNFQLKKKATTLSRVSLCLKRNRQREPIYKCPSCSLIPLQGSHWD